ncbi:MAG: glucose-6-phosphate dehydrogenase assembly protein OpcA [Thermoanaerobaculia bacterium]
MEEIHQALAGAAMPVDVGGIERALAELWRVEGSGTGEAVTRAALWNVIAIARNERERTEAGAILAAVSEVVPQRSLLIETNLDAQARLDSWISAHCHLVGDGSQMCSEEVTIVAGGEREQHVPSLIRALLLPDMPVAAWWLRGVPAGSLAEMTTDLADLVILDSATFENPEDFELAARIAKESRRGATDLQWMRIEEWRRVTALAFDPPPMRALASGMKSIRIRYGASGTANAGDRSAALLFAGWMLGQLRSSGKKSQAAVALERQEMSEGGGQLVEIEIDLGRGAGLRIVRCEGAVRAFPRGVEGSAPAVVRLYSSKPDHLVRRALAHGERDAVCERALGEAAAVLRRRG